MRNKTTTPITHMSNNKIVISFAILAVIVLYFNRDTEAEANEPKDYSFMSRSATLIDTLEVENNEYRKQKEALNLLIKHKQNSNS